MIAKDSQSYRILSITLMSGECSEEAVGILLPMENYRQKILYKLIADKLLNRFQKDDLKGYRLTKQGKEMLLTMDLERFSFFGAEGADFSMRRTPLRYRQRQHRISEVLALMEKAGMEIYRDRKCPIFERDPPQSAAVMQSVFYHAKEVKAQTELTRKIISSRLSGVWLSSDAVWLTYNIGVVLPKWYENVENRADILIRSMLREKGVEYSSTNALLFGESMVQAAMCLEDAKMRAYILNSTFRRFCFVPLDEIGSSLLRLLNDAEQYQYLTSILAEDLRNEGIEQRIEQDGYNEDGQPVLICVDCDLKRLIQFKMQMDYLGIQGEVICFDFQKEVIQKYCGEETKISEVDFEAVRENFLSGR